MARPLLQTHMLARAAKALGGVEPLARALGLSQVRLTLYEEGFQLLPQPLFLKLVDLLVNEEVARLGEQQLARTHGGPAHDQKSANGKNTRRN